jgi:hypothetical protein
MFEMVSWIWETMIQKMVDLDEEGSRHGHIIRETMKDEKNTKSIQQEINNIRN